MRLTLNVPPAWAAVDRGGLSMATIPGEPGEPELSLRWSGLEILPDDQKAWVQRNLTSGAAAARLDVVRDEMTTTTSGWPLRVVETKLVGGDGKVLEWRLAGFYAFFEHGAVAIARCAAEAPLRRHAAGLQEIFRAARPHWSDEVAALSQLWDVQTRQAAVATPAAAAAPAPDPAAIRAALDAELAELDAALAAAPTAAGQVQRGRILRDLGQLDASLAACQAAIALDPALADAHRGAGLTLARMGRDVDAIAAWEAAAAADPADVDALYNAGQAHYNRKAYADALRCWQRALERDARDFGLVKKVIQAQHALGHHDDAASTTELLRELWRTSTSAAVRLADEAIVDQFEVADVPVMVALTLRPPDPRSYAIYAFRAPATAKTPAVCVRIETSDYARERGVPFVLSVQRGRDYKALGTSEHLPAYPDLRTTAIRLITEAFGKPDPVAS